PGAHRGPWHRYGHHNGGVAIRRSTMAKPSPSRARTCCAPCLHSSVGQTITPRCLAPVKENGETQVVTCSLAEHSRRQLSSDAPRDEDLQLIRASSPPGSTPDVEDLGQAGQGTRMLNDPFVTVTDPVAP